MDVSMEKQTRPETYISISQEKLEGSIDALFALPLAEFTGARNTLSAELKRGGRRSEADSVKALAKPSSSAWAVNQIYFRHRDAFNRLLAAGERVRQTQALQLAGKAADARGALELRREALAELSRLAAELLQAAGHAPSSDTMRRVVTNLEAISATVSQVDAPRPGRLTADLEPPGFDSLAALLPNSGVVEPAAETKPKAIPKRDDAPEVRIDQARAYLHRAEEVLKEARDKAATVAVALEAAEIQLQEAERHKREAEERFKKASAVAAESVKHSRNLKLEAEQAVKAMQSAVRAVEEATRQLDALLAKQVGRR
jgi:hypothetical protein